MAGWPCASVTERIRENGVTRVSVPCAPLSVVRRALVGLADGAESLLGLPLLPDLGHEFAVLGFKREHALLQVGDDTVEGVGEAAKLLTASACRKHPTLNSP